MKALLRPILILLFIAQPGITAQSAPEHLPSPSPVTIYLAATSPKGQLLALSASDLSIQENKQPARIDRVECGKPEPLLLAVLLDTSGSRIDDPHLNTHYDTLKKFLASTLANGDAAYLVSFTDQAHQLTPPTSDLTVLNTALDQLKAVAPKGKTAVYDTLKMASNQNLSVDHVRRVILMIGDFGDNSSKIGVYKASAAPLESRSTLFVILDQNDRHPRQNTRTIEEGSPDDSFRVARETGGQTFAIESPAQFLAALDGIHNVLNHSCRVDYTPPSPVDSKDLIRLSAKLVHGPATLFAPQARPARGVPQPSAHN
jgi:Mg-chelatase subunit ChlD